MNFRIPEKDEYNSILQLVKSVLMDYGLDIDPAVTDLDLSDIDKNYIQKKGLFEILEEENQIIGSYGIFPLSKSTCELRKMYLSLDSQGKGLGKKIMERAFLKAEELGFTTMTLETNSRLNKALELYKKYGFTEYTPDHLSDRCDMAMRKTLLD